MVSLFKEGKVMNQIMLKRIYESREEQDGYRGLVDRLWSRGIKKEAA